MCPRRRSRARKGEGEGKGRKAVRRDSRTKEESGGAREEGGEENSGVEADAVEAVCNTSRRRMTCSTYEFAARKSFLKDHSFGYNNIPPTPPPSKTTLALYPPSPSSPLSPSPSTAPSPPPL
jgi:hypothetical protein